MKTALRKLYFLFGPKQRRLVRRIWFLPVDLIAAVAGNNDPLVPPKGLIFTGAGDFKKIGDKLVNAFITECNLSPDGKVLDIGCGIGRIARPLTKYLSRNGEYSGFDIVSTGIEWCKKNYTAFPNFDFRYIPLQNDLYNLSTSDRAADFTFPYAGNHFDLVVLTSVFTHMQEAEFKRYISEIERVLKPGGHCFATFFLITAETDKYLSETADPFFKYRENNFFLHDARVKDANIAYRYEFVEKVVSDSGMQIKSFKQGWWPGKRQEECFDFQDLLIISKL